MSEVQEKGDYVLESKCIGVLEYYVIVLSIKTFPFCLFYFTVGVSYTLRFYSEKFGDSEVTRNTFIISLFS